MKMQRSMLLFACVLALTGCQTPELDPGVYDGDKILFTADQAIGQGFDTLSSFVTWEYNNRATLRQWPDVKKAADFVRANVKAWREAALTARDAYAGNPTEANRSELQKAIAVVRAALMTAAKYQAQHNAVR